MADADLQTAMRATTFPMINLLMMLVHKGALSQAEVLDIVDVSGSIDPSGEYSNAVHCSITEMQNTLEMSFELKRR